MVKSFKEFLEEGGGFCEVPLIDSLYVPVCDQAGGSEYEHLDEGKWVNGRFQNNIRIDQPTHGVGQQHAHIYGRKGDGQLGVINLDGTGSHGTKMRLHKKDIDALTARGFKVPPGGIVEWVTVEGEFLLLKG